MRGADRLQKILYLLMVILGIYIVYKGGGILLQTNVVQQALESGRIQRTLEDSAVRTLSPGYAATVENREPVNWVAAWMQQVTPVYSYLAESQTEAETAATYMGSQAETEETTEISGQDATGEAAAKSGDQIQVETAGAETAGAETETPDKTRAENADSEIARAESDHMEFATSEELSTEELQSDTLAVSGSVISSSLLEQLSDFDYLVANYYTVDSGTTADADLLDAQSLLATDLTLQKDPEVPQILIYHTHSQEAFADSVEGAAEDTIIGMGEVLAEELRSKYGYNVIHDTGVYDLIDGVLDRSAAYDYAREAIEGILATYPTIEVVIDLHRDGVEGQKFVTEIDGKPTSMIMFFNGISRDSQDQPLSWLENPYVEQNLAFSLQLQLAAREKYPGFTRNIYLKAERFNLHLRPRSLLIEAGTQMNTVEEERNAMLPLADLLDQVLTGSTAYQ
jgi:stage II sporulation protein P